MVWGFLFNFHTKANSLRLIDTCGQ